MYNIVFLKRHFIIISENSKWDVYVWENCIVPIFMIHPQLAYFPSKNPINIMCDSIYCKVSIWIAILRKCGQTMTIFEKILEFELITTDKYFLISGLYLFCIDNSRFDVKRISIKSLMFQIWYNFPIFNLIRLISTLISCTPLNFNCVYISAL